MWVNHVILALAGLVAGFAISAGTFSFLVGIGVVPRLIGKSNTARSLFAYETMAFLGGVIGNIFSVFLDIQFPLGRLMLILFGFCSGIFVGCLAVTVAEILNTFPIVFRRLKLSIGLAWVMAAMALGKTAGALFYFWNHYETTL